MEHLRQLYRHRVLVDVLIRRELKGRYRGTVLGLMWSFVNPLVLVAIYSLVFSIYMRVDMKHYPIFLLAGLLPWNCLVTGLVEGTSSIMANAGIVKRVYLPSAVFPLVSVLSNVVHYLLSVPILIGLMLFLGFEPRWSWLFFPVVLILQIILTYGFTLLTSAMAVQYRDLLHIIPNLIIFGLFLTPIFYPPSLVPERFRFLLDFNPLTPLFRAHHAIFYSGVLPDPHALGVLAGFSLGLVAVGMVVFDRRSERFAEFI